jgi:hypothetical protein
VLADDDDEGRLESANIGLDPGSPRGSDTGSQLRDEGQACGASRRAGRPDGHLERARLSRAVVDRERHQIEAVDDLAAEALAVDKVSDKGGPHLHGAVCDDDKQVYVDVCLVETGLQPVI